MSEVTSLRNRKFFREKYYSFIFSFLFEYRHYIINCYPVKVIYIYKDDQVNEETNRGDRSILLIPSLFSLHHPGSKEIENFREKECERERGEKNERWNGKEVEPSPT